MSTPAPDRPEGLSNDPEVSPTADPSSKTVAGAAENPAPAAYVEGGN